MADSNDKAEREKFFEAVLMADVGRCRQDELPLSDNSRSSYNPDRTRKQPRISAAVRAKLQAWGNPIEDEEAQQMEGLVSEGAPWRRGAKPAMQTITRAKPKMPASQPGVNAAPAPSVKVAPPPVDPAPTKLSFDDRLVIAQRSCSFESTPVPDEFKKLKVYWGVLLVRPNRKQYLTTQWEITIYDNKTSPVYATLTLKCMDENLPVRVHDINHLNAPYVDEEKECCVLATVGPVAESSYYIQLRDIEQTRSFSNSLYGLQRLVHQINSQTSSRTTADTPPSTPPSPARLVKIDSSEPGTMDITAIIEAVCHIDRITDTLAKINFNPMMFETLDDISTDWYKHRYPEMDPSSRLSLTTSIQDVLKRHIGTKQNIRVCEPGHKPSSDIPESIKDFTLPITYTEGELTALRGQGCLPEMPEWTSLSAADSKIVWRKKDAAGLDASRWSSNEKIFLQLT